MVYQINGSNGIYDNKTKDNSVKYGRNAVNNNIKHLLYLKGAYFNILEV